MEFEKSKLEWIEFALLEKYPHVAHGVFLRHGGTSKKPFDGLNVSNNVGDHPDSVKVNRELIRPSPKQIPQNYTAHCQNQHTT